MSEHDEMKEQLDRIEVKLDLLTKALGFKVVSRCEDPFHRLSWSQRGNQECSVCGGFSSDTPHIVKL